VFIAEHERVKRLGVVSVKPLPTERNHVVLLVPMTDVKDMGSFSAGLEDAIYANRMKLEEARGLRPHLAILIDRSDASPTPEMTSVPELDGIERLWVIQPWARGSETRGVWVAASGDTHWRVY
jgi:hypothetical protein